MGEKTGIEWTDSTWSPIRARNLATGKIGWHCEHMSEACRFCYAESINRRLGTSLDFKPGHRADVEIFLDEKMLLAPLRWKKPRRIFVNSMSDTFAEFVKDEWIDRMFAVMALAPQHTFQVLTKRPERMRRHLCALTEMCDGEDGLCIELRWVGEAIDLDWRSIAPDIWPLPNVWLGTSAEDQATADERIPLLLDTPAAVRFVSLEPLLGPIDLEAMPFQDGDRRHRWSAVTGQALMYGDGINGNPDMTIRMEKPIRSKLDWVIVGGESGRNARPMSIQWVRELRDQCAAASVPFFFKQFGEWAPAGSHRADNPGRFAFGDYEHDRTIMTQIDGYPRHFTKFGARSTMQRIGKKRAGRLLDGRTHDGMPSQR